MPHRVERRSGRSAAGGDRRLAPVSLWIAGLVAALTCLCVLAAFRSDPMFAEAQAGEGGVTGTATFVPATATPMSTPASTPTVSATLPVPVVTLFPEVTPTSSPQATDPPAELRVGPGALQDPVPTPTAPPPAPTDVPMPGDPHVDYLATTASCAGCHRAHTAMGRTLRDAWPEEALCFACHASAGPGTDVSPAFAYTNTATAIFKHDVAATSGVHRVGEMEGPAYGGENRHVECEDCHEPHEATRGAAGAPMLQREMHAVSGVDPAWTGHGAPVAYTWLPDAEREYQVCFKCHSGFTTLPAYLPDGWDGNGYVADGLRKLTSGDRQQVPDHRDMAQEFNPNNISFHPVVAQGRNQNIAPGAFVAGWSATSFVYCTDCHANPALAGSGGTHGSPLLHLLNGGENYQTASPDAPVDGDNTLCLQCHDAGDYLANGPDSNFRRRNRNLHAQHADNGTCYLCHDSHGSEQLHLLNLDLSITADPDTYLLPGYDGLPTDSQTYWQISPDGSEKTCWIVCHTHDHTGSTYPNISD